MTEKRILKLLQRAAAEGLEKAGLSEPGSEDAPGALERLMELPAASRAWKETVHTLARYLDDASPEELVRIALEVLPRERAETELYSIPREVFEAIERTFSSDVLFAHGRHLLTLSRGARFLIALAPPMWPRALRTLVVEETERGTVYAAAWNLLTWGVHGIYVYIGKQVKGFGEELKGVLERWRGDFLIEPVLQRMIRFPWDLFNSPRHFRSQYRRKQILADSGELVERVSWREVRSIITDGLRAAAKWMDQEHRANFMDCYTLGDLSRLGTLWLPMSYLREALPPDHPARLAFIRHVGKELYMEDEDRRIALVCKLGNGTALHGLLDGLDELIERGLIGWHEPGMRLLRALDRKVNPEYLEELLESREPEVVIAAIDGLYHHYEKMEKEGGEGHEEALRRIRRTVERELTAFQPQGGVPRRKHRRTSRSKDCVRRREHLKEEVREAVRVRLVALGRKLDEWMRGG